MSETVSCFLKSVIPGSDIKVKVEVDKQVILMLNSKGSM